MVSSLACLSICSCLQFNQATLGTTPTTLSPSLELRPFKKASSGGTIGSLEPKPGPTQKPVLGCLRPNKILGEDTAPPMSEEAA